MLGLCSTIDFPFVGLVLLGHPSPRIIETYGDQCCPHNRESRTRDRNHSARRGQIERRPAVFRRRLYGIFTESNVSVVAQAELAPPDARRKGSPPFIRRYEVSEERVDATGERKRFGQRLRQRRLAAGLSQAQLAGKRFSHAFISTVETGRRGASKNAIDYFAQRLGIPSAELWGDIGPHWAMQMALDLREKGLHQESRDLLVTTLENLQRDNEVQPRVLAVLHLELGWLDLPTDPASAEKHLSRCLELAGDDDLLLGERAEASAGLGHVFEERQPEESLRRYKASALLLMDLLGRSPRFTRLERLRRLTWSRAGGRVG